MEHEVALSGMGGSRHEASILGMLQKSHPGVVAIAAAFVSVEGVRRTIDLLNASGVQRCRLIAGIDHLVTHPEALFLAREAGWSLRIGSSNRGIFHPKLIVAGGNFGLRGSIRSICGVYVGSSNLTLGGLARNVECGWLATGSGPESASNAFAEMWISSQAATDSMLRTYASRFAERARTRSAADLKDIGVNDAEAVSFEPRELRRRRPPLRPAVSDQYAVAAWAGLQSFTGGYRFQIEFPRQAGEVIGRMIGSNARRRGRFDVYCPDDGTVREMQYGFYAGNSMFRLNVPNDAPGVEFARANHDGIAILEKGLPGGVPLRLRILRPGYEVSEIVGRSAALGTWGRTSTRLFGWY